MSFPSRLCLVSMLYRLKVAQTDKIVLRECMLKLYMFDITYLM